VFNIILIISHLRLKTEEKAKISKRLLLLYWKIEPIKEEINRKGRMNNFSWNSNRNDGANFCHVINNRPFLHPEFLVTPINHWWKGDAAILIIKDILPNNARVRTIVFISPVNNIETNRRAEEMDWIIKYFILISKFFDLFFFVFLFIIEQNAIVFSSKRIQIEIHEFTRKHPIGVIKRVLHTKSLTFIFVLFKLQIWFS